MKKVKLGRPSGGKNKVWSQEEKIRIVKRYIEDRVGQSTIAKEEEISNGMLWNWIDKYQKFGEGGLENKKKKGNKFAALHTSKKMSKLERLELENLQLKIENERLKMGYSIQEVNGEKKYVLLSKKNTK